MSQWLELCHYYKLHLDLSVHAKKLNLQVKFQGLIFLGVFELFPHYSFTHCFTLLLSTKCFDSG